MMLTAKGRYAVMAMVDIAISGGDKPVPLADIARRQDITVPYLEQIFSRLKAADLVESVRGPGGGYRLSRACSGISIGEIVLATDEEIKMTRCDNSAEGCMVRGARCLTHDLWEGLEQHIHEYLASTSLDDVCQRRLRVRECV